MISDVLSSDSVQLGLPSVERDRAIRAAGEALVDAGHADEAYVETMFLREEMVSTYLGNGIAIPHGTSEGADHVRSTGIVVLQFPDGVDWGAGTAHLVVGIAARDDSHIGILSALAEVLEDEAECQRLFVADSVDDVVATLSGTEAA